MSLIVALLLMTYSAFFLLIVGCLAVIILHCYDETK